MIWNLQKENKFSLKRIKLTEDSQKNLIQALQTKTILILIRVKGQTLTIRFKKLKKQNNKGYSEFKTKKGNSTTF